jgi:hypothetical protein
MQTRPLLASVMTLALASFGAAHAASAEKRDVSKMTCEAFAAETTDSQVRIAAYLDGRSKRGKPVEDVAAVDVERDVKDLVVACSETPRTTIWDKISTHLPGGKKKVKPVEMSCEEYVSHSSTVQAEVAYWLAGYHGAEIDGADEVDVEHDVNIFIEECKNLPKEHLWKSIRQKVLH